MDSCFLYAKNLCFDHITNISGEFGFIPQRTIVRGETDAGWKSDKCMEENGDGWFLFVNKTDCSLG